MEKNIYIPGSHPANSIVLQALILLSQCNPMAHGWTIYLSWLQTKNELQSDGFGAKPPKAEQAWPRRTNKILNYNISHINSFCWKNPKKQSTFFFHLHPKLLAYCSPSNYGDKMKKQVWKGVGPLSATFSKS